MKNKQLTTNITNTIKDLLLVARTQVVQHVNTTMVNTYFEIGKVIVEHEQQGQQRAKYNTQTLKAVSQELTTGFGKGFSVTNLERMRLFYLQYSISATVLPISDDSAKPLPNNQKTKTAENSFTLSWSHYVFLMRLDQPEREFYQKEANINNWSLRELRRQFDSALYERVVLSRDKQGVLTDNLKKYHSPENPKDTVKDPYIYWSF